jgi:hypothetical protein
LGAMWEKLRTLKFGIRSRIVIAAIFFVIALTATAVGTVTLQLDQGEAEDRANELQDQFDRINDPVFIFGNNFALTLGMFVPAFGPIWGCFVLFQTGTVVAILGIAEGMPPVLLLFALMFTPIFWMEFGVYAVAMAQSTILLLQILRHSGKKEAVRTCIVITACALVLLAAALIEWGMINTVTPQILA